MLTFKQPFIETFRHLPIQVRYFCRMFEGRGWLFGWWIPHMALGEQAKSEKNIRGGLWVGGMLNDEQKHPWNLKKYDYRHRNSMKFHFQTTIFFSINVKCSCCSICCSIIPFLPQIVILICIVRVYSYPSSPNHGARCKMTRRASKLYNHPPRGYSESNVSIEGGTMNSSCKFQSR